MGSVVIEKMKKKGRGSDIMENTNMRM